MRGCRALSKTTTFKTIFFEENMPLKKKCTRCLKEFLKKRNIKAILFLPHIAVGKNHHPFISISSKLNFKVYLPFYGRHNTPQEKVFFREIK